MKNMKTVWLLVAILLAYNFSACKKKDKTPPPPVKTEYVSGQMMHGSGELAASLWINGTQQYLTNGTYESSANSVLKHNNDIYVAGYERNTVSPSDPTELNKMAVYWKNGTMTQLTNGSTNAEANSIAVSGNDVYVAGTEYNSTTLRQNARLWKNGMEVTLTNGANWSFANDVALKGNDIYVVGQETISGTPTALIWKNGVRSALPFTGTSSNAHRILLDGNDVYVIGARSEGGITQACYWKNGAFNPVNFIVGGSSYYATHGLVKNGVLHLVGFGFEGTVAKPVYWHNGIAQKLAETSGVAYSIADINNVLTVAGRLGEYPAKWENGVNTFTGTTQGAFYKIRYE